MVPKVAPARGIGSDGATRRPLLAANWKAHGDRGLLSRWCDAVAAANCEVDCLLLPPAVLLPLAQQLAPPFAWGAQDVCLEAQGPYTGDVTAAMLLECGASHTLVGHSECRRLRADTDARVASKYAVAAAAGLVPVLCVGETLAEREAGRGEEVVSRQLGEVLARSPPLPPGGAVLAYEPVWAIGTGRVASPEMAQQMHGVLRQLWRRERGGGEDGPLRVLYGGSVQPGNAAALARQPDVDGFLVGGASLAAADFLAIAGALAAAH